MEYRWRAWGLHAATLAGGVLATLSGAGAAALLRPSEPPAFGEGLKPAPRAAPASAPASETQPASQPLTHGEAIGDFKISFYVLTEETSYQSKTADTPVYKMDGSLVGKFSKAFVSDLRIQG